MSRNFTSEQTLIDQLLLDDTEAFEELYHRYCFPLYSYCIKKLQSPEDGRRIVRDLFIDLWDRRHELPVNFSVSTHMYTEVRKAVIKVVNEKLVEQEDLVNIEKQIIPGFAVMQLNKAKQPARRSPVLSSTYMNRSGGTSVEHEGWQKYALALNLKGLRHAFQSIMNLW